MSPAREMLFTTVVIRVLILEPDAWRCRGLCSVLRESGEFEVSGETDYTRILSLKRRPDDLQIDVVGLAHRLMLEHGTSVIGFVRELFEPCSVIVHGDIDAVEVAAQAYSAGARGYFVLSNPPGHYPKAVSVVASGKYWGRREAIALMAERAMEHEPGGPGDDEERQILQMLNEGLSNKEIGQRLGLAEATVKARLNRMYRRFGVASRLQLLSAAIRDGLV